MELDNSSLVLENELLNYKTKYSTKVSNFLLKQPKRVIPDVVLHEGGNEIVAVIVAILTKQYREIILTT